MIWEVLPTCWAHGAFIGNGRLGAMIYLDDAGPASRLVWEVGRSDVYDSRLFGTGHERFAKRLLIGQFQLSPVGKIMDGTIRIHLWNAEATGAIRTDRGEIRWRSWVQRDDEAIVISWEATDGEREIRFVWRPHPAADPINARRPNPEYVPNPPGREVTVGSIHSWIQPLAVGGDLATAWCETAEDSKRLLFVSVGFQVPQGGASDEAIGNVRRATARGLATLSEANRTWWHEYYPASFVSLPDTRLEGFYWIQLYKMASATRPDAPVLDLCGPWLKKETPWPAIWWNLNVQVAYWMHLTANQLFLGESLLNTMDRNHENLVANAPAEYRADSAFLGNPTGPDMRNSRFTVTDRGIFGGPEKIVPELNCLPWLCHNYFWQYRYSMDNALLIRLLPLLRRAINLLLHLLEKDNDGRLHFPETYSAEYGPAPDACQDLAIIRWGCRTLLWSCERLGVSDPLIPRWQEVLARLVDYPQDDTGLMIGRGMPMTVSHRHFSHLMAICPFYEITPEISGGAELIRKSVRHWLTVPIVKLEHEFAGFTWCMAASMASLVGDGDDALHHLCYFLDAHVLPNTMYAEGHQACGPTIETPLMACRSVQDMLLQSWGDRIRIFPAVPDVWADVVFHQFRTEGAFLVSAARKGGETRWIQVISLAGDSCRIQTGLRGPIWTDGPDGLAVKPLGNATVDINLAKGQTVLLFNGNERPDLTILPVNPQPDQLNAYGLKKNYRAPFIYQPV